MTHSQRRGNRGGFTLVEILVALIILAVLTAFVVPDVMNRVDDGDAPRVATDLVDIATAIELFKLDMRTVYPADLEDLVIAPTAASSTDSTITAAEYGASAAGRWDGPYMRKAIANGATIQTAYKGRIHDRLNLVRGAVGAVTTEELNTTNCVKTNYIALAMTGIDSADFEVVNDLVDGPQETDGSNNHIAAGNVNLQNTSGSMVEGNLRFKTTGDSTFYLVTACR